MTYGIVGYDEEGQAVYGEIMGDGVMGDRAFDVVGQGYGMVPYGYGVVGAAHPHHRHIARHGHGPRHMAIPPKPQWRDQLAPGVIQPDEGMVPLPLTPNAGSPPGTFTAAITTMTWQGQLQKPYRAERLLVSVVRTGATATGRLLGQLFVGTDLQQAEITGWDVELVGQAGAFGTRLTAKAAEPGVLIRMVITLSNNPTGTDTIFASMNFLGRVIH
jgi:hypothetical protein